MEDHGAGKAIRGRTGGRVETGAQGTADHVRGFVADVAGRAKVARRASKNAVPESAETDRVG